jgi:GNAT superfamily N-acetyltransferase
MNTNAAQQIRVKPISLVESDAAVKILLRAFREDPTCGFVFQNESAKYFERMKAFFKAGNSDHFSASQPVFGIFCGGLLTGAAYLRSPNAEITPWTLIKWLARTGELGCAYRLLKYENGVKGRLRNGRYYYLVLIGIDPDHQGVGHGSFLMHSLHDFCRQVSGIDGILLDTGNLRNIQFYEHLGYRQIGSFRLGNVNQKIMFRPCIVQNAELLRTNLCEQSGASSCP